MATHVLAYRTEHNGDWTESVSAEYLPFVREAAEMLSSAYPHRQYAIFVEHLPAPWWSGKRRYLYGATDAELYERKYGEPMLLGTACGGLVQVLDRNVLH